MIVCFGEPLLDVFASPLGATFQDAAAFVPRPGGAPLNVAMVLGRAGVPTRFVGSVGEDAFGSRIVGSLREAGVDTNAMVRSRRKTGMVFVEVGRDGSRAFLGYADGGAEYAYTTADWRRSRDAVLEGAGWLVVGSGSFTREPVASAARRAVVDARKRNRVVLVDLNVRPPLWKSRSGMNRGCRWLASQAVVLRASEEDLEALGVPPTLDGLASLNRGAAGVLTRGAAGAEAVLGDVRLSCPAPRVEVVDTTGAGDAFTAGLAAHLSRAGAKDERAWEHALACACRFGSHCCTALGCSEAFAVQPIRCEHEVLP